MSGNEPGFTYTMSNNIVNSSSTKAEIIQASSELIGELDSKLEIEQKLSQMHKEESNSVIYLLIATSAYGVLF